MNTFRPSSSNLGKFASRCRCRSCGELGHETNDLFLFPTGTSCLSFAPSSNTVQHCYLCNELLLDNFRHLLHFLLVYIKINHPLVGRSVPVFTAISQRSTSHGESYIVSRVAGPPIVGSAPKKGGTSAGPPVNCPAQRRPVNTVQKLQCVLVHHPSNALVADY